MYDDFLPNASMSFTHCNMRSTSNVSSSDIAARQTNLRNLCYRFGPDKDNQVFVTSSCTDSDQQINIHKYSDIACTHSTNKTLIIPTRPCFTRRGLDLKKPWSEHNMKACNLQLILTRLVPTAMLLCDLLIRGSLFRITWAMKHPQNPALANGPSSLRVRLSLPNGSFSYTSALALPASAHQLGNTTALCHLSPPRDTQHSSSGNQRTPDFKLGS